LSGFEGFEFEKKENKKNGIKKQSRVFGGKRQAGEETGKEKEFLDLSFGTSLEGFGKISQGEEYESSEEDVVHGNTRHGELKAV
jgi:hypothetical protein